MRESRENRVELKETSFEAFELLIKYIYTGKMHIPVNQIQLMLNVMELANKYDFPEVKNKIANFLKVYSEQFYDTSFPVHMHGLQYILGRIILDDA